MSYYCLTPPRAVNLFKLNSKQLGIQKTFKKYITLIKISYNFVKIEHIFYRKLCPLQYSSIKIRWKLTNKWVFFNPLEQWSCIREMEMEFAMRSHFMAPRPLNYFLLDHLSISINCLPSVILWHFSV
jgi:hypothetical protein